MQLGRSPDFSSTSAMSGAAKTLVTITAPPVAAASACSLHLGNSSVRPSSVSTLTIASVPPSLLLEPTLAAAGAIATGSVSAAATPVAPSCSSGSKHTTFALTPTTTDPRSTSSGHHVSFMPISGKRSVKRLRSSNSSLSSPTTATATASAPSLIEAQQEQPHRVLELRQSVQSQITTLEDVDDMEDMQATECNDSDSDSVGLAMVQTTPQLESHVPLSSSSSSSVK